MNKQVNNRRDVSKCFQKNQSLWLPWQREVQVGAAPYVTNYVYVCVCIYHLGFLICKRGSGSMWASAKNDFRAFYFNMVCLHLLSVSSSLAICLLAVYHQPQFLSSTLRTHEQQTKPCVCTAVLIDCLQKAAHCGFTITQSQAAAPREKCYWWHSVLFKMVDL